MPHSWSDFGNQAGHKQQRAYQRQHLVLHHERIDTDMVPGVPLRLASWGSAGQSYSADDS
jgi:hypothetical protein